MVQSTEIRTGMLVRSREGERLGHVIGLSEEGLLVEKGVFRPHDYRISLGDVLEVRGDEVLLALGREQLERVGPAEAALETGGGLGLRPDELTQARMESAKFQDHGRYPVRPPDESPGQAVPSEPVPPSRRRH